MPKFLAILTLALTSAALPPAAARASEEPTCADVLATPTFRDALTRNDGRDWRILVYDAEGRQLLGLKCDIEVLDAYFATGGWSVGRPLPRTGSKGPFGPTDNRFYFDAYTVYSHCTRTGLFWSKKCKSYTVYFFEGRLTHITGGGVK